jgi:hypothetical protein
MCCVPDLGTRVHGKNFFKWQVGLVNSVSGIFIKVVGCLDVTTTRLEVKALLTGSCSPRLSAHMAFCMDKIGCHNNSHSLSQAIYLQRGHKMVTMGWMKTRTWGPDGCAGV